MKKSLKLILLATIMLAVAGCSEKKPATAVTSQSSLQVTTKETSATAGNTSENTSENTSGTFTSTDEMASTATAKLDFAAAVEKFHEIYPDAVVTDFQWQAEGTFQGRQTAIFEIEGADAKGEYELTFDAATGEMAAADDLDEDGNEDWQTEDLAIDEVISMEEAIEKATKEVPAGFALREAELEEEEGKLLWKIKFGQPRHLYFVVLDAKTEDMISVYEKK